MPPSPGFTATTLDLTYATGVTSIKPLTDLYGPLTSVDRVYVANSSIESLDMTLFPNATLLHAWGDAGSGLNKIASINFGTYTDDEHACKVTQMFLSSQSLTGTIDLRNCIALHELKLDGNQLEGINLGKANGRQFGQGPHARRLFDQRQEQQTQGDRHPRTAAACVSSGSTATRSNGHAC